MYIYTVSIIILPYRPPEHFLYTTMPSHNEAPTVRGLAADKNNQLYMETMIFIWNNHYNLNFNV